MLAELLVAGLSLAAAPARADTAFAIAANQFVCWTVWHSIIATDPRDLIVLSVQTFQAGVPRPHTVVFAFKCPSETSVVLVPIELWGPQSVPQTRLHVSERMIVTRPNYEYAVLQALDSLARASGTKVQQLSASELNNPVHYVTNGGVFALSRTKADPVAGFWSAVTRTVGSSTCDAQGFPVTYAASTQLEVTLLSLPTQPASRIYPLWKLRPDPGNATCNRALDYEVVATIERRFGSTNRPHGPK